MTATVISLEHKQETDFGHTRAGLSAHLQIGEPPHSYFLSQLVGETGWIIDAHFGPQGMPYYCHGFGARYLKVRAIAPELANLIDRQAHERGLSYNISQDPPLA